MGFVLGKVANRVYLVLFILKAKKRTQNNAKCGDMESSELLRSEKCLWQFFHN